MFNKRVVIRQKAKIIKSLCLVPAFGITLFAILFIPYAQEFELFLFAGLFSISYLLVRRTVGFRSWISESSEIKYSLCIGDDYSNTHSCIPFVDITSVELCEYSLWGTRAPAAYADRDYHRIYTQFGYQGSGLIICYNLPGHIGDDSELRSWQLPVPKAEKFLALLQKSLSPQYIPSNK